MNQCWGIYADSLNPFNSYVHITGYLFLPIEFQDEATYGYRWQVGD